MEGHPTTSQRTSCLNYGGRSSWPGMLWALTQHETCCWTLGANIMPFCLWETHWDLFFFFKIENKSDRVRATLCFLGLGGLCSRKDLTCTVASSDLEFSALFYFLFSSYMLLDLKDFSHLDDLAISSHTSSWETAFLPLNTLMNVAAQNWCFGTLSCKTSLLSLSSVIHT